MVFCLVRKISDHYTAMLEPCANMPISIHEAWGTLDALVSCTGIFEKTDLLETEIDRWRVGFDCIVNGCFLISRLAIMFMGAGGRIIHISSIHGARAEKYASSYSMAKSAINQYC